VTQRETGPAAAQRDRRSGRSGGLWILPHPLTDGGSQYVGCGFGLLEEAFFGHAVLQAFREASRGDRSGQIAADLSISVSTVRNHLKAVYRKSGIRSQPELVQRWRAWLRGEGEPS
jgi:hypothetical protein